MLSLCPPSVDKAQSLNRTGRDILHAAWFVDAKNFVETSSLDTYHSKPDPFPLQYLSPCKAYIIWDFGICTARLSANDKGKNKIEQRGTSSGPPHNPWSTGQICVHQDISRVEKNKRWPFNLGRLEKVFEHTTSPQEALFVDVKNPMSTLPRPLSSGSKHVQLQENSSVPFGATQAFVCIVSSFRRIYPNPKTLAACVCSGTLPSANQAVVNYDWNEQQLWQHQWTASLKGFYVMLYKYTCSGQSCLRDCFQLKPQGAPIVVPMAPLRRPLHCFSSGSGTCSTGCHRKWR